MDMLTGCCVKRDGDVNPFLLSGPGLIDALGFSTERTIRCGGEAVVFPKGSIGVRLEDLATKASSTKAAAWLANYGNAAEVNSELAEAVATAFKSDKDASAAAASACERLAHRFAQSGIVAYSCRCVDSNGKEGKANLTQWVTYVDKKELPDYKPEHLWTGAGCTVM
mmetsp:Transcript_29788/g.64921  ORF Transcript_29788/g.64921 Transcript_29788/m.64921 type:complete len:167 (-) Transcript_29788:214-714(-)